MINVAIANDQLLYCEVLSNSLSNHPGLNVLYSAPNCVELSKKMEYQAPDVLLIDLSIRKAEGFMICEKIKPRFSHVKVVVISGSQDPGTISLLISKGANAYLPQCCSVTEMIEAIKSVYINNYFFTPMVSEAMAIFSRDPEGTKSPMHSLDNLTDKEKIILKMICDEYTSKQMAHTLRLSTRTIEFYRKSLLLKTNSANVAGLVSFAFRSGLMD